MDKDTPLSELSEDSLLARLLPGLPQHTLVVGPGDDCAVVDIDETGDTLHLLKTDAVIEGIHFLPGTDPIEIGWKATARVISDFAAMGGRPLHLLATLAIPRDREVSWLEALYRGFRRCLDTYETVLAGGETCGLPIGSPAMISISGVGEVARKSCVLRSGGAPGDILGVTGKLGGSFASGRHLNFTPRIKEGQFLAAAGVTAMMDLSDGLARDLPRLAQASRCSYELDLASLPRHSGVDIEQALKEGEDYELLFSAPPKVWDFLLSRCPVGMTPITKIGRLNPPEQVPTPLTKNGGWDHFQSKAESPKR